MKIESRHGTAAIRRESVEEEVRNHRDRVTGASKQISKRRQQVDLRCNPSIISERPEVKALTVWRMKRMVTSIVQVVKPGWQQQLRLRTTPSVGSFMPSCMLLKIQKAGSNLSRLTKKV